MNHNRFGCVADTGEASQKTAPGVDNALRDRLGPSPHCARVAHAHEPRQRPPQGPWDPDKKPKFIDTTYFWTLLLPLLGLIGASIALVYFFGS